MKKDEKLKKLKKSWKKLKKVEEKLNRKRREKIEDKLNEKEWKKVEEASCMWLVKEWKASWHMKGILMKENGRQVDEWKRKKTKMKDRHEWNRKWNKCRIDYRKWSISGRETDEEKEIWEKGVASWQMKEKSKKGEDKLINWIERGINVEQITESGI